MPKVNRAELVETRCTVFRAGTKQMFPTIFGILSQSPNIRGIAYFRETLHILLKYAPIDTIARLLISEMR